jgi:hypothetical protein
MTRQHYGAIAAVIVGYLLCRLLSYHVVDAVGDISGHNRAGGVVVGVVLTAIPFVTLFAYTGFQLAGVDVEHRTWVKAIALIGWFVAGVIMGVLPYSRFGADTDLLAKDRKDAPGFLHAVDFSILIGLLVTVALLLVVLRSRSHHAPPRD